MNLSSKVLEKKAETAKPNESRPKFHCAVMQRGTAVEDRLIKSLPDHDVIINHFSNITELYVLGQRVILEMIIIAGSGSGDWILDMIPRIKQDSVLQFIPIVIFHPEPDNDFIIPAYKAGVDDVFAGFWDYDLITAKIEMLVARSKRDLGVNPTTKLPGPASIENEINRRLQNGETVATCYADLDNFKAYNDYHGYVHGDKIILMVSHIIRNTVHDLVDNGYIGHIGGDDFVFLIPIDKVDIVCKNIIATFDRMIPYRYSDIDREKGFILIADRKGQIEKFPIMTISIAVLPNQRKAFKHIGEMSHMMADLKKYTKTLPGSNYMIERREKY